MEQYASVYNLPDYLLAHFLVYLSRNGFIASPGETKSIYYINGIKDSVETGRMENSIRGSVYGRIFIFKDNPKNRRPYAEELERVVQDYPILSPVEFAALKEETKIKELQGNLAARL